MMLCAILLVFWGMFGFLILSLDFKWLLKGNIFQRLFILLISGPIIWFLVIGYISVTNIYKFLGQVQIKESK